MPTVQQQREKLVSLLKELFQLDQPDLDFGFYRIMHAKAKQVTGFLENDLLKIAAEKFGENNAAKVAQLQKAYEDAVAQAKSFGAADPEQTDPVKRARAALEAAKDTSRAEGEVYDHLYRFFERYYDAGDFMSRRYLSRETSSKAAAYAVPYDGSEVYMHWANKDQYYIKTAEYLTNFTFDLAKAPELRAEKTGLFGTTAPAPMPVHFRVVSATEGEHGNVKASDATKRYFILHKDDPVSIENDQFIVRFEYRSDPEKPSGKQEGAWQAQRNNEAVSGILKALDELGEARAREYLAILKKSSPTEKQTDRLLLARYVAQYTARNTMDYFIHKDLGGFLGRELDFYIKNEVMRLDDIESADAPRVEQYLAPVRVLRQIAGKMIDFLTQLENFQKKLWLKKKFITECHYCITLDRIPEEFYSEIAANDAQREEWVKLFAIDHAEANLSVHGYSVPLSVEFLMGNQNLMIDTVHFSRDFVERLIPRVSDLDKVLDGVCIHSENFQALLMLRPRYRSQIRCVYIDPPYNTDAAPILYKNGYKSSTWTSLIQDRLLASRSLLVNDGVLIAAIDDEEQRELGFLLSDVFEGNELGTVCVRSNPSGRPTKTGYSVSHEYLLFAGRSERSGIGRLPPTEDQMARFNQRDEDGVFEWRNLRREGTDSDRSARRALYYPIFLFEDKIRIPEMHWDEKTEEWKLDEEPRPDEQVVYPDNEAGDQKRWRWEHTTVTASLGQLAVRKDRSGRDYVYYKRRPHEEGVVSVSSWFEAKYSATEHGTALLKDMFGQSPFMYPKSIYAVIDAIYVAGASKKDAVVLDYFAGSGTTGHAVIALNRKYGGARKYVLVEMGDYFDSVVLPRLKKAIYAADWDDGLPGSRDDRCPHMIKYIRLESYEDTLNNLEFADDPARRDAIERNRGLREDYMLHYMLDVETQGSASLLNIDRFADPTGYKLKVKKPASDEYDWKNVDLLETFNYLLGMRVEHIAAPQVFTAEFNRETDPDLPKGQLGRLVVKGRLKQDPNGPWWFRKVEGWVPKNPQTPNDGLQEKVLIVWRKLTGDIEQDNLVLDEWFRKYQINPRESYDYDTIYVNGSNNLPNLKLENENWRVRLIEEDFHRLMWDVEEI